MTYAWDVLFPQQLSLDIPDPQKTQTHTEDIDPLYLQFFSSN